MFTRATLREYFDKVKDQLNDVKSDPTKYLGSNLSDYDLEKLQEYLRVVEDQIEYQEETHKQQDGAKNQ